MYTTLIIGGAICSAVSVTIGVLVTGSIIWRKMHGSNEENSSRAIEPPPVLVQLERTPQYPRGDEAREIPRPIIVPTTESDDPDASTTAPLASRREDK